MPLLHLIILAIVQGITEFLPISSSGHLVLVPLLTGWDDQGIALDIAVHVGTLAAVCWYARKTLVDITVDVLRFRRSSSSCLGVLIVLATIPVIVAGFLVKDFLPNLRSLQVIACATIGFGVLLYVADRLPLQKGMQGIGVKSAIIIGLAQILALIPGTSRSGITMTAARFLQFDRKTAADFSFLLSIPTIVGAAVLESKDLIEQNVSQALIIDMLIAALLSGLTAFIALKLMMRWIQSASFTIFVVYRLVLGFALLGIYYLA